MILMAGAMLFVACQKDGENLVDLTAVVSDQPTSNSKVYLDGNLGYWQHGDQVMINGANETYNKYTLSVQTDGSTTAKILNVVKDENDKYTAAYPASQVSAIINGESVTMTIPQKQTYQLQKNVDEGTADSQHVEMPMVAYSKDGTSLKFYNTASLIRLNLVNNTGQDFQIHYVTVTATTNNLSGTGTVSVAGLVDNPQTLPSFSISENGDASVTLDCCDAHPLVENGKNIILYLVVAPFGSNESRDRLNVTVMAEDGDNKKYTFNVDSRESGLYIERGQIGAVKVTMTAGLGTQSEFWGQGKEPCPYLIADTTDLKNLRKVTNAGTEGYVGNTVYYKQIADIDISGSNFSNWGSSDNYAIGNNSTVFSANYDGANHSVKLGITSGEVDKPIGIFGVVGGGGTISNLCAKGTIATISKNKAYVGGIAGLAKGNFTFSHCINKINYTTAAVSGSDYISVNFGGICARIDASGCTIKIKNCKNKGNLVKQDGCLGGICAYIAAGNVSFTSDTNDGTINHTNSNTTSPERVSGGILGFTATDGTSFDSCINLAAITATASIAGGICGYIKYGVTFTNCINDGKISTNSYYVGGILAYGTVNSGYTASFTNCENRDTIYSTSSSVGGILGNAYYSTVDMSGCTSADSAYVEGTSDVGGLIGKIQKASSISNCINRGDVKGSNKIGGVLGEHGSTEMASASDCINNGVVTATTTEAGGIIGASSGTVGFDECENHGNISGTTRIGGIIGYINYSNDASQTQLTSCSNSGKISGSGNNGGFIGESTHNIVFSNCMNEGSISSAGINIGGFIGLNNKMTEFESCENTGDNKTTITPTNEYDIQSSSTSNDNNVGGFGGKCTKSRFTNCTNSASVYGHSSVGGLCGQTADFVVNSCENIGHIYGKKSGSYDCKVGGFLGYAYNTATSSSEIKNSVNRGSVTGLGKEVGGIVGYLRAGGASIKNCYSTGAVSAAYPKTAGGIFGYTQDYAPSVENCYVVLSSSTSNCAKTIYGNDSRVTPKVTNCYDNSNSGITSNANYSYSVSTNQETLGHYITTNSNKKLLVALNEYEWQSSNTSYCTWTTITKDSLNKPIYTELPILSWEDPSPVAKRR